MIHKLGRYCSSRGRTHAETGMPYKPGFPLSTERLNASPPETRKDKSAYFLVALVAAEAQDIYTSAYINSQGFRTLF